MPEKKTTSQVQVIAEGIPNGLFTVDQQWTVKSWNKAAEELLGIRSAHIIGKDLWETFAGIIPVDFYAAWQKIVPQDAPVYFEGYWPQMESSYQFITCYKEGSLFVSFKKKYLKLYAEYSADQFRALHELYQLVTQVTNDCLWEWDLQNNTLFWIDGGHKRIFGHAVENALIPREFWEIRIHPDDSVRILAKLDKVINEGMDDIWEDEYRFERADGSYAYVHDRGHIIYEGSKACRMIGATQDITAKKLAEKQLMDAETKLMVERLTRQKDITKAVLAAQEKERADIGKKMQDNLGQVLGAAKLYIEMAKTDPDIRDLCLDKSSDYIAQVIGDIRRITKTLAPELMIMGLKDSIKMLLIDLNLVHPINISFSEEGMAAVTISENLQMALFRIIQVQLSNIIMHAKASQVNISLGRKGDGIELIIVDDGVGCDMIEKKEGLGIRNIISRTELYHGSVVIESKPGEGYKLQVLIPLHIDT